MREEIGTYRVLLGDALTQLRTLPDQSVHCVVTSPPYWRLRSYLDADDPRKTQEVGTEAQPQVYITRLVGIFREVRRVLKSDGTVWVNLGDVRSGSGRGAWAHPSAAVKERYVPTPAEVKGTTDDRPPKNLLMIPARFALAMQDDGWLLRSKIVWEKGNAMPSSVTDRPSDNYEEIFLFSQSPRYYYDAAAIAEPAKVGDNGSYFDRGKTAIHPNQGRDCRDKQRHARDLRRNRRSVWHVNTVGYADAHFAVFPEKLVEPMILAGCPVGGTVLDPFAGSGTTLAVANRWGRHAIGIELNPDYARLIEKRCAQPHWILTGGDA